jgi:PPK2 family polyphosphate:nucleotide phosphotransferase
MPFENYASRFLVRPGVKVNLAQIDAADSAEGIADLKKKGEKRFEKLRDELQSLQKVLYAQGKHRILIVLQAMDTGGKDGCVKHVFSRVDPQGITVKSFKKPTEEDLAHDFLWRVHPHVPGNGQIVIFNRSHYEDIISVRVKNLREDAVWKKRYRHINDFERMLVDEGTVILKFFLHISPEEQKRRLLSRLERPEKYWKLFPDDIKDRKLWPQFMEAYEEIFQKTSRSYSPWYVVPADRKWYRNLVVAEIVVEHLRKLGMTYPQPTWDPASIVIE